jgi:isoleucyl-tRNA synthetase
MLGISGPEDVAKMGIKAYNDECRKIVMKYSGEWETIITRLGRWIGNNLFKACMCVFYIHCIRLKF